MVQAYETKRFGPFLRVVEREIFVIGLLVFGASMSTLVSSEDTIHFALAWSLATTRSISLNGAIYGGELYTVQIGGHTLSGLPPGLAFFTFLLISLGEYILPMKPQIVGIFIGTYLSSVFGAIASVLFFKISRMFGSERSSAILTLVFAFGTSLWIYSRMFLPEALATCLSIAGVYFVLKASEERTIKAKRLLDVAPFTFLAGMLIGLSIFVDNMTIFFLIPLFLYLLFRMRQSIGTRISSLVVFIFGGALGMVPSAFYDSYTTGNVLLAPYGELLLGGVGPQSYTFELFSGLYNLLLSPTSGLLFFTPFVIISLLGFSYFARERRAEFALFLGLFFSILLPLALQSGSTYLRNTIGPSELVLAVPYILIPAISVLNRFRAKSFIAFLSYALAATSIVITGIIALTAPSLSSTAYSFVKGASPLIVVNIPLFLGESYLTWWSFFTYPIIYAILIIVLPLATALVYSTKSDVRIWRRHYPLHLETAVPKTLVTDPSKNVDEAKRVHM